MHAVVHLERPGFLPHVASCSHPLRDTRRHVSHRTPVALSKVCASYCSPLLPSWPCSHLVLLSSLALLAVFTPGLHTAGADALLEARARVVAAPVDLARVARPDEAPPHPTARSQRATRLAALLLCWLLWSRSLPQLHVGLQAPHGGAQDPALWCATHRRRIKPGPRGRSSPL